MTFCPIPHCTRDQIWLSVGVIVGAALQYVYLTKKLNKKKSSPMVKDGFAAVTGGPKTVTEYFGPFINGEDRCSAAIMQITEPFVGDAQRTAFEEWIIMLEGKVSITRVEEGANGSQNSTIVCSKNQSLYLPPGHYAYECLIPGTTYVSFCMPGFRPELIKSVE